MKKRVTAIILAVSIFVSLFTFNAAASEVTKPAEQTMYTALDKLVNTLVGGIAAMIKTPRGWINKKDYQSENFYEGNSKEEFLSKPADNAVWSVGYSNASILTGKEVGGGDYYVGGSLSVTKKLATKQYDDQKVRTVAISDGRGISIFATIDSYGLANSDVRAIRAIVAKWAKENNIELTSVNISTLHQHSCVDTFGLNGDIVSALFTSSIKNFLNIPMPSGQNKDYMDNLYKVTTNSIISAINNMETGKLYFGTANVKELIRDKRDPQVFDENLNRLRFVPDNNTSKETWIVNGGIHCVGKGAAGTSLTGDYPYYMEKYINENENANFFYIQGAELALTNNASILTPNPADIEKYDEGYAYLIAFGTELAKRLCAITDEKEVAPIFNIAFKEVWVKIDNNILVLAAKGGLLKNTVCKTGIGKYEIITEVGYCEIGKDLAISIIPGELAPEIAFGGADTAEKSWTNEDWALPYFTDLDSSRKLLVFGLTNDQVGYLLTSNNWHSYFTENEEIVSTGKYAGVTIANAYIELQKEFN